MLCLGAGDHFETRLGVLGLGQTLLAFMLPTKHWLQKMTIIADGDADIADGECRLL